MSHKEREHATLSPSKMGRYMACEQSFVLESSLPSTLPSRSALEGTEAHEYLEKLLTNQMILDDLPPGEMKDSLTKVVSIVTKTYKQIKEEIDPDVTISIEQRVDFTYHIWGTPDIVIRYTNGGDKQAIVMDFKYGLTPVSADTNTQLMLYALGVRKKWKWVDCLLVIIQPRISENSIVNKWNFTRQHADSFTRRLYYKQARLIAARNRKINPRANVGPHCTWCEGKPQCPQYIRYVSRKSGLVLDKAPDLEHVVKDVDKLSDKKISAIVTHSAEIRKYLDDVEKYALTRVLRGKDIEGLKVVQSRATRKWMEDASVEVIAAELLSMGVKNPYKPLCLRNITDIEKEIGKGKIDSLVEKTEPTLKIVSVGSPGEPVVINSVDQFTTIEND